MLVKLRRLFGLVFWGLRMVNENSEISYSKDSPIENKKASHNNFEDTLENTKHYKEQIEKREKIITDLLEDKLKAKKIINYIIGGVCAVWLILVTSVILVYVCKVQEPDYRVLIAFSLNITASIVSLVLIVLKYFYSDDIYKYFSVYNNLPTNKKN